MIMKAIDMARWTENDAEALHLSKLSQGLPPTSIVELRLHNGKGLEGVIRGMSVGNNGGGERGFGPWHYYGSMQIQDIKGAVHDIDMLDVASVADRWAARSAAYEAAGLISIIDLSE